MPRAEAIACTSIVLFPILALAICLLWNWKAGTFTYQMREQQAMDSYQAKISELVDELTIPGNTETFEEV